MNPPCHKCGQPSAPHIYATCLECDRETQGRVAQILLKDQLTKAREQMAYLAQRWEQCEREKDDLIHAHAMALASESQREAAETADETPDGQAENA